MSQLLKAMDVGSGSFYAAFGSKPELFAQVIEKYDAWSALQWERIRTTKRDWTPLVNSSIPPWWMCLIKIASRVACW